MAITLQIREREDRLSLFVNNDTRATLEVNGIANLTETITVTPGDEEQDILPRPGYLISEVIVERIPSYYGRIAFNGGVLSVY